MSILTNEEFNNLNAANTWEMQRPYIEKIEEMLLDKEDSMNHEDVEQIFRALTQLIEKNDVRCTQRSLKIVDAVCSFVTGDLVAGCVETIFPIVCSCLGNEHGNIREQSIKTIVALCRSSSWTPLASHLHNQKIKLEFEIEKEILQVLFTHKSEFSDDEWNSFVLFIVQCLDHRSSGIKSKAHEFTKDESFIAALNRNVEELNSTQKRLVASFLDKKALRTAEEQTTEEAVDDVVRPAPRPVREVTLNTSAFSRKQRQREMSLDSGIKLLTDISSWNPFVKKLSLDIRDVFDDEVAGLLLSHQSQDRLAGVEELRNIFHASASNFEHSADIVLRWCCYQFIGRHLSVSQAALLMILDEFNFVSESFQLSKQEACFAVPIVLWCIATLSSAYTNVLRAIASHSTNAVYGAALLLAIDLQHSVVLSTLFDELRNIPDLSSLEEDLKKLAESPYSFVSTESKRALLRLTPCSPRSKKRLGSIDTLQHYIAKIKTSPEDIIDSRTIFGFILDEFQSMPSDEREIRYLLYCTNSFLTEPLLSISINISDFNSLVSLLCEFSMRCPTEFSDALDSIAFSLVSINTNTVVFENLIDFIEQYNGTLTRQSFVFRMFSMGVSMLAVSYNRTDISQLRIFAKNVIKRAGEKDLRAVLCRLLLAEIVVLEQQHITESAKQYQDVFSDLAIQHRDHQNSFDVSFDEDIDAYSGALGGDSLDFFRVIEKLSRRETRSKGIKELVQYDERYPGEKIADTVIRLVPSLRKDVEAQRNSSQRYSRPSSRGSYRGGSGNRSRPSSRSSQARPSSRSSERGRL